jgi:hypothetical protein
MGYRELFSPTPPELARLPAASAAADEDVAETLLALALVDEFASEDGAFVGAVVAGETVLPAEG